MINSFNPNKQNNHMYSVDLENVFTSANIWQAKDVGFNHENEIIGKCLCEVHSTNDANQIMKNNLSVFQTQKPLKFVEPVNEGNRIVTYISYKSPIINKSGNVIGLMGFSIEQPEMSNNKLSSLTSQQKSIIYYLSQGFTAKQIGHALDLSHRTIEHYIAALKTKLNCKNTKELITQYTLHFS